MADDPATSSSFAFGATSGDPAPSVVAVELRVVHRRRLRAVWRSAGWPCQDDVEVDLLAAGMLGRERDGAGRETLRLTDAGIALLAATRRDNRARRDAHEALVQRVAREMRRAGRLVWRNLALRAWVDDAPADAPASVGDGAEPSAAEIVRPTTQLAQASGIPAVPGATAIGVGVGLFAPDGDSPTPAAGASRGGRWAIAMPDVYSIRQTTREDYLAPVAHEIKVRRADLLADLRRPAKGAAYRWLAGECWYVIRDGIADPSEIPPVYGVLMAPERGPLVVARAAPSRALKLPFAVWMELARAAPDRDDDLDDDGCDRAAQGLL